MARCEYCGKEVYLPYKCKYCGGIFCAEHHLPENHDCLGLQIYRQRRAGAGQMFTLPSVTRFAPEYVASKRPVRSERVEEELKKVKPRQPAYYEPSYSSYRSESSGSKAGYVLLGIVIAFVLFLALRSGMIPGISFGGESGSFTVYLRVSNKELTQNPEAYVGKKVEVTGVLGFVALMGEISEDFETTVFYTLTDDQGYWVMVIPPSEQQRSLYFGSVYTARGVWQKFKFKKLLSNEYVYRYMLVAEEMERKG